MQRYRNECNWLSKKINTMRRVNSKDNFPKIIREYLHQSDKTLIDLEIAMAQVVP
jgi:hypothetical protein